MHQIEMLTESKQKLLLYLCTDTKSEHFEGLRFQSYRRKDLHIQYMTKYTHIFIYEENIPSR